MSLILLVCVGKYLTSPYPRTSSSTKMSHTSSSLSYLLCVTTPNLLCAVLTQCVQSDISECSERSYDEDAVSPTATVAFVRRLPRETSVVLSQGSALSPTSTFWGDLDEYKQPSHPEDVRCVRYRPSFVKMLSVRRSAFYTLGCVDPWSAL